MMSLINDETDYKFSDICKSDDKWVHDGNWVSHPNHLLMSCSQLVISQRSCSCCVIAVTHSHMMPDACYVI